MYCETWYKTWCPNCDTVNFHCNGNESDLTECDVEAIECHGCGKIYSLGDDEDASEHQYVEKGVLMVKVEGEQK